MLRLLHSQLCLGSPIPVPDRFSGRRRGCLREESPNPVPDHTQLLLGRRERAWCWVPGAAGLAESRDGTKVWAVPAGPGSKAGGLQQDNCGADSPQGLPVVQGKPSARRGSLRALHRVAALLPIKEKSLRQQILLSVKMPLRRGSSCLQNQGRAAGFEKILSLASPGVSMEICPAPPALPQQRPAAALIPKLLPRVRQRCLTFSVLVTPPQLLPNSPALPAPSWPHHLLIPAISQNFGCRRTE